MVRWLSVAAVFLWAIAGQASSEDWVRYQVAVDRPSHHQALVTMLVPATTKNQLELVMPVWRPGKYRVLPLSNGVLGVTATDARGRPLKVVHLAHNKWRVEGVAGSPVEVQYRLYADSLGDRTRHIDKTHAYLDPVSALLMVPEMSQLPVRVDLDVPDGWRSESGMKRDGEHRFLATSYDQLADSPIETGLHEKLRFRVGKVPFEMVVWGESNLDSVQAAKDLARIAQTLRESWGDFPFESYLVIVHATDGEKGATEHRNSTVIQRPRWSFGLKEQYLDFLSTGAHELIHAWNVKAYRPEGLVPYDYERENTTRLLWFVEGGTSYLDELALLRAGLMDADTYLKRLAKTIAAYENRPGNRHMSASESSLMEWVRPEGEQAWNYASGIYQKGAMLNLWLDLQLQADSNGSHDITDLHRRLYQGWPAHLKGYAESDIQQILTELGMKKVHERWQRFVDGTEPLPLKDLLAQWSIEWRYSADAKRAFQFASEPDLGVRLISRTGPVARVRSVDEGSPAWKAGMTQGDWLLALGGKQTTADNFHEVLLSFKPRQRIEVAYFHRGRLYQETVRLGEKPAGKLELRIKQPMAAEDLSRLRRWLGESVSLPQSKESPR